MSKEKCLRWCQAAGIRALRTMAQTALATLGTTALVSQVDWLTIGSATLMAGLLSVLTALTGLPEVDHFTEA